MRNKCMEATVRRRFNRVKRLLNERQRRLWAAAEAEALEYGGISTVARATGISRRAIHTGLGELKAGGKPLGSVRVRRPGAGRKSLSESQPHLKMALDALVEPTSRGDPQSPMRWTCRSVRRLAAEARTARVSHRTAEGG